ncbi:TonB-dependent receptor [uncultured Algimonas sp.]|uniref:TonB-dependent receptor domain-containing protein n=1 Tax=uncultured Algimonas sp. TaxID=1547920 RepID=UPI002609E972|nr:TonB-dependent receptor [uncultured Algimonas sp.]
MAQQSDAEEDVIITTGTLIPRSTNLTTTSPVTQINAAEFDARGVVQVEDLINTLPQAFGAQGSNLANGATGTSSINLRGLGSTRNLVLVNGRRMPYGSLNTAAADVNFIPSALVSNVEILTGGASATYGSDAITGVVNFIIDDEFEGARLDTNFSFYQHNNNGPLQGLLQEFATANPDQYRVPNGSVTDGETIDITGVVGGFFDGGRGHATAFAGYQKTDPIFQGDRDYAQCALGTRAGGNEFSCSGSPTNQVANLLEVAPGYAFPNGSVWARIDPAGTGTIIDRDFTTDTFNFNPFNHYQRPNERYNLGAFVNYEITPDINFYSELLFMENSTNNQIAPSGVFGLGVNGDTGGVNCNNPFLSAQQVNFLCTSNGLGAGDVAPVLLLRRNVEGGPRNNDITHTTFRLLAGFEGDISGTNLGYDVSASYARVRRSEVYNNDLSIRAITRALNAVDDGAGNPICAINSRRDAAGALITVDPACVPYDIFSGQPPNPAAVDYLSNPLLRTGTTEQTILTAKMFGDFGDRVRTGWADDTVAFAVGVEYRKDELDSNPDGNFLSGDGAGQGGPTNAIAGEQDVLDIFGELDIPLVQNRSGFYDAGLDLAYRRSEYDNFGTDSYKVGLDWSPVQPIRFRGSYQRAVRAANVFELFAEQSIGLFDLSAGSNGLFDPCAGTTPAATAAQCANTGVTAAQYGSIADNPAGQFNTFGGGNLDLEPEVSDTYTFGFVFQPSFADGLTVSVDYFDISVDGFIGTVPEQLSLNQCLETGQAFFCDLVNRGSGGTLWANNSGFITATNLNTGELSTSGIDFLAGYDFRAGDFADMRISYVGTLLNDLTTKPLPTSTTSQIYDCAGYYGGQCGAPNPEYRHKVDFNLRPDMWDSRLGLQLTWRHFGSVNVAQTSGQRALAGSFANVNRTFGDQDYIDLSGNFAVTEDIIFRAGVNNVFDVDPPLSSIVGTAPGNGNTYPQVYDAFGRYIFMGATIDF